jgi:hypothetical protein
MREGAWVLVENGLMTLKGSSGARIFRRDHAPMEISPGSEISALVGTTNAR